MAKEIISKYIRSGGILGAGEGASLASRPERQRRPALTGWRAEVFGNDARLLRKGDLAIALENGDAVVVELEG